MKYRVELAPLARKQLAALDRPIRARVVDKLETLADNPRPSGCKQLKGDDNLWRVRVGDYRVVFAIYDDVLLVLVARIAHRREVYR